MKCLMALMSIILMLPLGGLAGGTDSELTEQFDEAAKKIVRVAPSAFRALPSEAAKWMIAGGFTVPQSYCDTLLHNVIHGKFNEDDVDDWAALCSRADTSWVVVFWGGLESIAMLDPVDDRTFLQGMGDEGIVYSRILMLETPGSIRARYHEWELSAPEWVNHDGIADVYCGKASSVFYWREGELKYLLGTD